MLLQQAKMISKLYPPHLEKLDVCDVVLWMRCLAQERCMNMLSTFDELLDPLEMYYMDTDGMPMCVREFLLTRVPDGVLQVMDEVCASFVRFSNWRNERMLPNWEGRRHEVDASNPLRCELIEHLQDRIMEYADLHAHSIYDWCRARALAHWVTLRQWTRQRCIVFYWWETSQKRHYSIQGRQKRDDAIGFATECQKLMLGVTQQTRIHNVHQ